MEYLVVLEAVEERWGALAASLDRNTAGAGHEMRRARFKFADEVHERHSRLFGE